MQIVGAIGAVVALAAMAGTPARPKHSLEQVRRAIEMVESSGNPRAVGDGGEAVGILQIHEVMVRDVNRILREERYTVEDRWCVAKSREMFNVYTRHYTRCLTPERVARRWNGGPRGDRMRATEGYWRKVQRELRRLEGTR